MEKDSLLKMKNVLTSLGNAAPALKQYKRVGHLNFGDLKCLKEARSNQSYARTGPLAHKRNDQDT